MFLESPADSQAGDHRGPRHRGARAVRNALLAIALLLPAVAFAAIGVNKTFNGTNVSAGQVSTLAVILINNNPAAATAATFTDTFPVNVVVANPANASTTCVGGIVTATSGNGSFSFSGGTIPAAVGLVAGQCTVQVDVVSATPGVYINTIPAGAVTSSQGASAQAASATLTVAALRPITAAKAFAPTNLHGGGTPSTVTLTLTNPNGVALTSAALTDALPAASLSIASPPNTFTSCGAGTVSTTASSASLSGGTIPANGSCIVRFDVVAANPNVYVDGNVANSIAAGALTTTQGVTNPAFSANVRLQTGARVEKSFAPTPITTGGTSTLTVTVRNFNSTPLSGIAFTDAFPGTMRVAAPVVTGTTCTSLLFSPVPLAGDANFSVTSGTLPAAPAGIANANCTVTINVTATNAGVNPVTLTNTIPVGNFSGVAFSSASGALVVNQVTSVGGSKSFAPAAILQGQVSTLTITLTNSALVAATITSFTDLLTTLGATPQFTVAGLPSPPASTTCGGVINAAPGATTITLGAGNSIPAAGTCTLTVPVQASATASTGARTNSIAQGALVTSQGRTQSAITGVLTVNPVLSVAKAFAPATVAAGGDTRLTITLTRAAGASALSGLAFNDPLPAGHVVSATPNLVNNCGGIVTAAGGSVSLAGGSLAGGAAATSCTILVNITTPAGAGAPTNTIAAGAVTSTEGFTNPTAASAVITRVVTNVTLNKSFSPATVLVGATSTLTINILNTNANALALTTIGLVDTLPAGMAVAAAPLPINSCGGAFAPVAGAGSISLIGGALGANATCSLQVHVVANASGNLIDTLGANLFTSAQGVTNPLAASATLAATGSADLAVTKTDGVINAVPGTSTTYTIVARNNGPNNVAGAGVVDNPPAGMTFTGWTCAASAGSACGNASGSGPINELVTLLNGGTATYTVTAAIVSTATGTITNTATVVVPGTVIDTVPANNTASDTDTLTPQADLAISKTDGVASVIAGTSTAYTIVVSNAGPSSANGAIFQDPAVANLNVTSVTCGSASGGAACPTVPNTTVALMQGTGIVVPTLPPGGNVTFTVTGSVPSGASGVITNVATVTAPAGVSDTTPGNNIATDVDTITRAADLAITKTDGVASVVPGGTTTYTIVVSNSGPSNVIGATVSDILPAAVTSDTFTAVGSGGAAGFTASGAGNINDTVTLPVGSTITYTLVANISGSASGNLVNTATVTPPAGVTDTNPGNNSATDSDTLTAQVTLAVVKSDGSATYTPGGTATYTVTVTDTGVSDAGNVTVTDLLPAGLTLTANVSCTANGVASCGAVVGSIGGTSFSTTGATVGAGGGNSLVFTVPVAFASGMITDPLVNQATATDLTTGATAAGTDSDTLAPQVTLAVVKSDGSATYTPGGSATYTVTLTHGGVSDATNVTLSDPLPAGVTLTANATCVATGVATCGTVTGTTGQTSFGTTGAAIAAGPGNSLVFTVPVAFAAGMATDPLVNTATALDVLSGATGAGSDSDTRAAQVTLAVSKSDGSATYTPGTGATYLVGVGNTGVSNALNVTVGDLLPAGVLLSGNVTCVASGSASCGSVTGSTGQASFSATGASINAGGGNALTFTVPVAFAASLADNPLTNTATAQDLASGATGSATDNDTLAAVAALTVTKNDGSLTYTPGGTATYTIIATNAGPSDALNTTVTDPLPAGVTLTANVTCVAAGIANCGTVTGITGQSSFGTTGASIAAGGGNSLTFTVPVAFAPGLAVDPLVNTVTVSDPASAAPATANDSDTLAAQADLAITKSDGVISVVPGTSTTYTIVVSNNGPSNVVGATVSDLLPAAIISDTFTTVASGGASGFTASGAGNINDTVNMPAGSTITYTLVANISAGASGNLVNTATVTPPAGVTDTNPGNNSATDTDTLTPRADLAITKTDGVINVIPGTATTYTIVVSNSGPSNVIGATVSDILPAAIISDTFTAVGSGGASGFTASGVGNINDTVNMPAGSTITYTLTANISGGASGNLVNTATVTPPAGVTDTNPANNSATDTDTLTPQADLAITKTDGVASVVPGGTTTYTIVVSNSGPSNVIGATVSDILPAAVTSDTFTAVGSGGAAGFTASGAGNINDTVTLPVGSTITYTLVANISGSASGNLVNTATVTPPAGVTDTNPGNNSATDSDTLTAQVTLAVVKSDGSATYTPGGTATYTVTVTDTGVSDAGNVTVTDLLPAGLTLTANVSCTANGVASCGAVVGSIGGTSFSTTGATVGAGGGNSLVFTVPVAFASGMITDPLVNQATATDLTTGATAAGTDSDTLAPQVTLAVVKSDGSATYTPGGSATYTVTLTHGGVSDATNVTLSDPLPAGVTLTANATCVATGVATCGTVTGTTGQTSFGTTGAAIAAGPGNSLVFTVPVAFAAGMATDPLVNTATALDVLSGATGAGSDSDTRAAQVTLAVSKSDGSATYTPGTGATYLVGVGNTGVSNALNVTVGDLLPAGVLLSGNVTCVASGSASCGSVTGSTGQASFSATGASINAGGGNALTFTVPVAFAASLADNPLTNTATAQDLASGATGSATDNDTLAAQADLAITKSDGVVNVVPGTATTYTIVVSNNGPSDVIGATVSDILPAAVASDTFTAVGSGGAAGFTASGAGNLNDTVSMPVGSTITYTLIANISGSASGNLANTATVTAPVGVTDTNPANNSATDTDTLAGQADLAITKSDGVISVVPGTSTTYTIVVSNNGPSDATGAAVSDVLPAAIISDTFTAVGSGGASGFTASGAGNINDTVNMPVGSSITYTLVANISGSASGNLVNTATVTPPAGVTDTNPANNSAIDTDTLTPQADLAITKTDGVISVAAGGVTTYTIVVSNSGPSNVVAATVSDVLPAAITSATFTAVGSGGASGFTASGAGNINDTVNMPAGSTITYTLVANISGGASGNLVNTATVTPPAGVTDTNPGNNSATDTDTIIVTPMADLGITKTDGSATYTPGSAITYTIVVSNAGPAGATGASVVDALPAVITGAAWTCVGSGGGTCPGSGSGNINVVVNLPVGASVTFTLTGTIAPTASGNLVNTATVTPPAGTTDPNPANNSATDTDTPTVVAGLAITKTDGSATYTPGGTGTYTITVTNNGPSNANSVTVTDNLPAGVTLTGTATCVAAGTATCGTLTGTTGGSSFSAASATIAAGGGNRLVFTLPVRFAVGMNTNPLTNVATASDPASVTVASASDTNALAQGAAIGIPVDNRWALSLLAAFILLIGLWQSHRPTMRRSRM